MIASSPPARSAVQTSRFFLADRLNQIDIDKSPTPLAPDIAVEILSPSHTAMDVRRKVRDYLRAGTKEIWLPGFSVRVAGVLFLN
jgi:hypothetical protein